MTLPNGQRAYRYEWSDDLIHAAGPHSGRHIDTLRSRNVTTGRPQSTTVALSCGHAAFVTTKQRSRVLSTESQALPPPPELFYMAALTRCESLIRRATYNCVGTCSGQ